MTTQEMRLNSFLVQVFNDILRLEEESLRKACKNLSVSEMHVLDAIDICTQQGNAGMAEIAARLSVTSGTLTVACKTLEQKGYVERLRLSKDKRRVTLALTDSAKQVLMVHTKFHENMVKIVSSQTTPKQLEELSTMLEHLHSFFETL